MVLKNAVVAYIEVFPRCTWSSWVKQWIVSDCITGILTQLRMQHLPNTN